MNDAMIARRLGWFVVGLLAYAALVFLVDWWIQQ